MLAETTDMALRVWFSGVVKKVDFIRREIWIKTEEGLWAVRSRSPLNLPGIRLGDMVSVQVLKTNVLKIVKVTSPVPVCVPDVPFSPTGEGVRS